MTVAEVATLFVVGQRQARALVSQAIADRIVGHHDPDAVRRRADKAAKRKTVTSRDYRDGLGGLFITADAEEIRLCMTAVDALAAGVCPNDPRTIGQRRSAAATARLRGLAFCCACDDKTGCTATLTEEEISDRQARIVIHAICQKSTLDGDDDHDGFLDGHGPIRAAHARNLAARPDATVRDLDLDDFVDPIVPAACPERSRREIPALIEFTAQPADPYRPTATLDTLARGLFGTCTVPGCDRPAWNCELDHVEEYPSTSLRTGSQICPASGGPTCLCNIGPKCTMHHLLKTHLGATDPQTGWVDDQWADDDGTLWTSTTIHGITVETMAANQWLFTQLAELRCLHQSQAHAPPDPPPERSPDSEQRPCGGGLKATTEYKHAWRRAERARLRAERQRIAERDDPPPF